MADIVAFHFWSPTCAPCAAIKPTIADLVEEFDDVHFTAVNTHDDAGGIAEKLNVRTVPTMVVLYKGVEVGRHSGTTVILYYTLLRKARSMRGT